MKPDGTPTVEEVCAMMEQLQSWERKEVAERFVSLSEFCDGYDTDAIASATGYYVYEEDHDNEDFWLDDFNDERLIDEVINRDLCVEMLDAIDEHDENIISNYIA